MFSMVTNESAVRDTCCVMYEEPHWGQVNRILTFLPPLLLLTGGLLQWKSVCDPYECGPLLGYCPCCCSHASTHTSLWNHSQHHYLDHFSHHGIPGLRFAALEIDPDDNRSECQPFYPHESQHLWKMLRNFSENTVGLFVGLPVMIFCYVKILHQKCLGHTFTL